MKDNMTAYSYFQHDTIHWLMLFKHSYSSILSPCLPYVPQIYVYKNLFNFTCPCKK